MIINYFLAGLLSFATAYALLTGAPAEVGNAVFEGAAAAVSFTLELTGAVCLWSAVMELLERAGAVAALSRLLSPVLRRLFPRASGDTEILSALSENLGANLLGLGNAATPAGIRAAKGMARLGGGVTDELCLLVVLNTASVQLLPTSIAAIRATNGAESAFDIMPAVWFSSAVSILAGMAAAGLLRRVWR